MKINSNNRKSGFTLVEIMIVVAIIGLLAAIAVPNFVIARSRSQAGACINNLRQFDYAVQLRALEQKLPPSATYQMTDLYPYIKLTESNTLPACPAGGTYIPNSSMSNAPTCSLSTLLSYPHIQ